MNSLMDGITPGEIAAGALERRISELEKRLVSVEQRLAIHHPAPLNPYGNPYDLNRVAGTKRRK